MLQVAKTIARVTTHFRSLQCNRMLRCKFQERLERLNYPLLFATLRDKLLRVTSPATTCNVFHSSLLRCKLQEKLPRVKWCLEPHAFAPKKNSSFVHSRTTLFTAQSAFKITVRNDDAEGPANSVNHLTNQLFTTDRATNQLSKIHRFAFNAPIFDIRKIPKSICKWRRLDEIRILDEVVNLFMPSAHNRQNFI